VQANDGALTSTQSITVTVTNVNEAPTITSNGAGDTASVDAAENSTAVTTVTAADPDAGTTYSFAITGGTDADQFRIDAATGVLTFQAAPNFEDPADADASNTYEVEVQVSDGALTDTQTITITVTDVNDAPVITSNAAVNVTEHTTSVTTVTATDEDNDTLAYAITGGADADKFSIDAATGVLTFKSAPSYDLPTDADQNNTYEVEVTVTDDGSGTLFSTQLIHVTVSSYIAPPAPYVPPATEVTIQINGKAERAGSLKRTTRENQTVDTITVDPKKLSAKLEAEGLNAMVTIPVNTNADIIVGELNGQLVKNMEDKLATLEIKTERAAYTLPARHINIEALSKQWGEETVLEDITVSVEIAESTDEWVQVAENAARKGNYTIVAPPVHFTVRATHEGKTVEVTNFASNVERTIAIPDGVEPSKITTGIVIEPDGTVRHVPTKIIQIGGKYYAKLNSLTNSLYAVIWHPVEFTDMESHWAKDAVNDMGSRIVIEGTGEGKFTPDRDITRAEFAAIVVRGLGLKLVDAADTPLIDVEPSAWYARTINTAYAYQLISGYEDGTFRPDEKITREQAMVMIARAMRITGLAEKLAAVEAEEVLGGFVDMIIASDWAIDSIADSVQAGIISGRDTAHLAPNEYITRAEIAVIIQRLLRESDLI